MKRTLIISAFLALCSCAVDPRTGKKSYTGPNITGSIGFNGVSVGLTLWTTPQKPLDVLTIPPAVLGVPINTK